MARYRSGAGREGRVCIEFQELQLGNKTPAVAFLQFPWSVVHYVDETSPLAEYVVTAPGERLRFPDPPALPLARVDPTKAAAS